jgi:hypothetical protein
MSDEWMDTDDPETIDDLIAQRDMQADRAVSAIAWFSQARVVFEQAVVELDFEGSSTAADLRRCLDLWPL